jgi:hypothetical protein
VRSAPGRRRERPRVHLCPREEEGAQAMGSVLPSGRRRKAAPVTIGPGRRRGLSRLLSGHRGPEWGGGTLREEEESTAEYETSGRRRRPSHGLGVQPGVGSAAPSGRRRKAPPITIGPGRRRGLSRLFGPFGPNSVAAPSGRRRRAPPSYVTPGRRRDHRITWILRSGIWWRHPQGGGGGCRRFPRLREEEEPQEENYLP